MKPLRLSEWTRDGWMVAFFLVLCVGLAFVQTDVREDDSASQAMRHRARVTAVDNREVMAINVVRKGEQVLEATLLAGPHKGQTIEVINNLVGKRELDEFYAVGEHLLVQYPERDGKPGTGIARGHYRIHIQLILLALFAGLLLLVAGPVGLKALLSFVFAGLMIWKVMIPLFIKGVDPVPTALLIVGALTASISFLVGGLTRKGLTTFIGAFLGMGLTAGLATVFADLFHIDGAARPYAEALLYSGYFKLDLTRIFTATIFLAASGAVMDLAMDIAAAMDEIRNKHPEIGYWEHVTSGMRVGRSVIGTMTTTLLLAYSSSYMFMLMLFAGQGVPMIQIFNLNYVAAEVLNTLVGSFGLVTVAPFTAFVGGALFRWNRSNA